MRDVMSSNAGIAAEISKGWTPNLYLTNMSQAYFSLPNDWVAPTMFPICPVGTSSGFYYTFDKGDLARDNVDRKPAFGKVQPAIMSTGEDQYGCKVDQVIVGIDQIAALNYQRTKAPGVQDPRRAKVQFIMEQMSLHLDILFAKGFFQAGVWADEWTGVASNPSGSQFLKFTDSNFDPVHFFNERRKEIKRRGRRTPNKLALGYDAYNALTEHPDIVERVKFGGSTINPAIVTRQALAAILGFEEVKVLESTYNTAAPGEAASMDFICDSGSALMCYATPTPQVDEPSAGYIFTWDMLGNGSYTALDQYEGDKGTHSEFIEGLMSTDMKKTGDDLACFMKNCV